MSYIHTGTCIQAGIHTYARHRHAGIHTYMQAYIHTCIHTESNIERQAGSHIHINTYWQAVRNTCIHPPIHPYIHTHKHTYRHTYVQPDRQAYRQAYRGTYIHKVIQPHNWHTYREACIHTDIPLDWRVTGIHAIRQAGAGRERLTDMHTYGQAGIHTGIHTYIQADIHTGRETHIHTDRQTYKHTCIHTYIHTGLHTYRHIHTYIQ